MATFVVPAPAGTHDIGAGIRQGSLAFGQGIAAGFQQRAANKAAEAERKRRELELQQNLARLAAFQQQQQLAQRTQVSPGLQGPQAQQPNLLQAGLTGQFGNLAMQMALQRLGQRQTPTIPQQRAGQAISAGAVPGTRAFEDIATGPQPAKARAGALQIARAGDTTGLPDGTVFQFDPQGNAKIISEPGGAGLSPTEKINLARNEGKDFRADPRIKDLQIIERSERGMQAALKQSTSKNVTSRIASDQALGVLFQKMLDPTSVVRESEFARTPEGAALMSRVSAQIPKLVKGGLAISDSDRQALVDMAQKLLAEAKISANRAFSEFNIRAETIGLNKKIVFGGAKPFDITPARPVTAPAVTGLTPAEEAELQTLLRIQ
jgi:hypothetical protein